jgi:hypothetical protein
MLPNVFQALNASAPVVALIGPAPIRVYRHGTAPQGVQSPYVTWSVPGGDAQIVLDTDTDADQFRVQVDCWANGDSDVEVVASAVRAAVSKVAVLVAYVADERDAETQRFRISFAFDWILGRDL